MPSPAGRSELPLAKTKGALSALLRKHKGYVRNLVPKIGQAAFTGSANRSKEILGPQNQHHIAIVVVFGGNGKAITGLDQIHAGHQCLGEAPS